MDSSSQKIIRHRKRNKMEDGKEPLIEKRAPPDEARTEAKVVSRPGSQTSKLGLFSGIGFTIVLVQIFCEVSKQIANFSLNYYNDGKYPIPKTMLVVIVEVVKLIVTLIRSNGECPLFHNKLKKSAKFLLPSIIYGVNNNIYLYALTIVSPPMWGILISCRTVFTACVYKFILKRPITKMQFLGCFLIVASLVIAKAPDLLPAGLFKDEISETVIKIVKEQSNDTHAVRKDVTLDVDSRVNALPFMAFVLAVVCACNSVSAAVYMEKLFKGSNAGETFLEQQFWLYFYAALVGLVFHFMTYPFYGPGSLYSDVIGMSITLQFLMGSAVFFAGVGGIIVASILKLLDNVVKEYAAYCANVLTAVVCYLMFPDRFQFTIYMVMSVACLLSGIYLYERKKATTEDNSATQPVISTTHK